MDLIINNMLFNIKNLNDNKEDNLKKIFIIKKINEIIDICNTNNFIELKNNELKEEIEFNKKFKNILPLINFNTNFYETN